MRISTIAMALAAVLLSGGLFAAAAQYRNCNTNCYGFGNQRTCNTYCY